MPAIINSISIEEIRQLENSTNANIRIGSYGMDSVSPTEEIFFYYSRLQPEDISRIYLLNDFRHCTNQESCRLSDLHERALVTAMERVPQLAENKIDLRNVVHKEPVLVGVDLHQGGLTVIDGNHRLMAHYLRHGSVESVGVILAIHRSIVNWAFIPRIARAHS
jgi:hypothetical protein